MSHCEGLGEGWCSHILAQIKDYEQGNAAYYPYPPKQSSLPLVAQNFGVNKILDFGGSNGWHYRLFTQVVSNLSLSEYHILETPQVVSVMSTYYQSNPLLTYFDDMNMIEAPYDILYSNSALQYLPDVTSSLQRLIGAANPEIILLDDFVDVDSNDAGAYIQNWKGEVFCQYLIPFAELNGMLARLGYELLVKQPYCFLIDGCRRGFELTSSDGLRRLHINATWTLLFKKKCDL